MNRIIQGFRVDIIHQGDHPEVTQASTNKISSVPVESTVRQAGSFVLHGKPLAMSWS